MRILDRVLSAVLALALLAGGVVVAVEILLAGVDRGPWVVPYDRWREWAATTAWSNGEARLLWIALLAAGLGLLVVALWRRRPASLPLAPGPAGVAAELDRRGTERWLGERAGRVEGVSQARARVRATAVRVRAESVTTDGAEVRRRAADTVARHLGELGLARPLRVKAEVRSRRSP